MRARRNRLVLGARAAALVAAIVAGDVACTAATHGTSRRLPRAGSSQDDGTGLLARWSRGELRDGRRCYGPGCSAGGDAYGAGGYGSYGGYYYGGDYYGADGFSVDHDYHAYDDGEEGDHGCGVYGGGSYARPDDCYDYVYRPPPEPVDAYTVVPVTDGGAIEGTVTWRTPPRAVAFIPPVPGSGCETPLLNPTLDRSPGAPAAGVANTLVYLADIDHGKPYAAIGGIVEHRDCTVAPHMQIAAPIGITLTVANQDPIAHSVRVAPEPAPAASERIFNLALPSRYQHEVPLLAAGVYQVSCDDRHPAGVGWVVVPPHPYYAVTDLAGRFRLDDVPPGEYTLVAWHEPVITGVDTATGAVTRTAAAGGRVRVRVPAARVANASIDLR